MEDGMEGADIGSKQDLLTQSWSKQQKKIHGKQGQTTRNKSKANKIRVPEQTPKTQEASAALGLISEYHVLGAMPVYDRGLTSVNWPHSVSECGVVPLSLNIIFIV